MSVAAASVAQRSRAADATLEIVRRIDAPRELVFEAWTSDAHLVHWWGPAGCTVPSCRLNFRIGGRYRVCIRAPDGTETWMGGAFRDIVRPQRLVFGFAWDAAHGRLATDTLIVVTFASVGTATELVFRQTPFDSAQRRDEHASGWNECLARLEAYLSRRPRTISDPSRDHPRGALP